MKLILNNYKDSDYISPEVFEEQKVVLSLSLMVMLSFHFTLNYLANTYFPGNLLDFENPGTWIYLLNFLITSVIVLLTGWVFSWKIKDFGLAPPKSWWKPILVSASLFVALLLFSTYLMPTLEAYSGKTSIDHLLPLQQNLPKLLNSIALVWITSAILEEVIFRAFLINSLDILLGKNKWTPWVAVVLSAPIFGLIHAYQGFTGILVTGSIGFIFGVAYLLNGRRLWPIIFIHGLVDTLFLIKIYNM